MKANLIDLSDLVTLADFLRPGLEITPCHQSAERYNKHPAQPQLGGKFKSVNWSCDR